MEKGFPSRGRKPNLVTPMTEKLRLQRNFEKQGCDPICPEEKDVSTHKMQVILSLCKFQLCGRPGNSASFLFVINKTQKVIDTFCM